MDIKIDSLTQAQKSTQKYSNKEAIVNSGHFNKVRLLKILNKHKGAQGTVDKVIESKGIYTSIIDDTGQEHKREHRDYVRVTRDNEER